MHLKILTKRKNLLHLSIESYLVFYPFRTNLLEAIQMTRSVWFPIFCDFFIIHFVYMVSPYSSPDSDPSCDISDLADVADVFVANSVPQIVASDASQGPHFRCA